MPADVGRAGHELGDLFLVDAVRGHVVEQEQRLGTAAEDVVDAVGREIHAGRAQPAGAAREHQLGSDAVHRGRQQAALVERVEPGERAEPLGSGRFDGRPQPLDDRLGCRERDAGPLVRLRAPGQESTSVERLADLL